MTRVKKDGKFLNCFIKREILEHLTAYSDETGIPKTFVVEKALQEYLDKVINVFGILLYVT